MERQESLPIEGSAMTETFRSSWRHKVTSSEGYSVFLPARTQLVYRDRSQVLRISYEAMATPSRELVIYSQSLTVDEPVRSLVLDRVTRALEFDGWEPIIES